MDTALAKLIQQAQTVLQGQSPGGGNPGQRISVRVQGRSPIYATCGGVVPPGDCTIFQSQQGWVALSPVSPRLLVNREVQSRQGRGRDRRAGGRIKVLLGRIVEVSPTEARAELYIGGDRPTPQSIFSLEVDPGESISTLFAGSKFTVTGTGLNDWKVDFAFIDPSQQFPDNLQLYTITTSSTQLVNPAAIANISYPNNQLSGMSIDLGGSGFITFAVIARNGLGVDDLQTLNLQHHAILDSVGAGSQVASAPNPNTFPGVLSGAPGLILPGIAAVSGKERAYPNTIRLSGTTIGGPGGGNLESVVRQDLQYSIYRKFKVTGFPEYILASASGEFSAATNLIGTSLSKWYSNNQIYTYRSLQQTNRIAQNWVFDITPITIANTIQDNPSPYIAEQTQFNQVFESAHPVNVDEFTVLDVTYYPL